MATALGFGARPKAPEVTVSTFSPIAQLGDHLGNIPATSRAGADHFGVVTVSEGTTSFQVLAFPTIKANNKRLIRESVAKAYKSWLSEVAP